MKRTGKEKRGKWTKEYIKNGIRKNPRGINSPILNSESTISLALFLIPRTLQHQPPEAKHREYAAPRLRPLEGPRSVLSQVLGVHSLHWVYHLCASLSAVHSLAP